MKKTFITALLSLTITLFICGSAFAQQFNFNAQGSAIVPNIATWYMSSNNAAHAHIVLSNITDSTVTCQITVYDHEGNDVSSRGKVFTGDNIGTWTIVSVGTNTFELPPYGSRSFMTDGTKQQRSMFGHAVIKWKSTDPKLSKALVGGYRFHGKEPTGNFDGTTLINSGTPF